jgi:hypothetical protein
MSDEGSSFLNEEMATARGEDVVAVCKRHVKDSIHTLLGKKIPRVGELVESLATSRTKLMVDPTLEAAADVSAELHRELAKRAETMAPYYRYN